MKLKCQFHAHTKGDPCDDIKYTPKELIKKASKLDYQVLSITCHRKVVFTKNLQKYAKKLGILLIPGIEFEINKKHILGINVDKEIEKVDSYKKLKAYKRSHPNCLIIAPHPFFPGKRTLKRKVIENIQLFDAIENSFCYTKTKNYNNEAIKLAKRWKKPIIATSDCHILKHLDLGYCFVEAKKSATEVIKAIKKNRIQNITKPISYFKITTIISRMKSSEALQFLKKILKK